MALTKTDISKLYVAIFNRASEGEGNKFWISIDKSMADTATEMLNTQAAKDYFGTSLDSNQAFIEHIYLNTLNKTTDGANGTEADAEGIAFWVGLLDSGTSRGDVVAGLVEAATDPVNAGAAQDQFNNRVAVSDYMADTVETIEPTTEAINATSFSSGLTVTSDPATVTSAEAVIDAMVPVAPADFTLTSSDDTLMGTEANEVFDGSTKGTLSSNDLILDSTKTDSDILNITVTNNSTTPTIQNIETINITGEYITSGLDLSKTTGTNTINVDTKLAGGNATLTNITATSVNVGSNITSFEVTADSDGTDGKVTIDTGSASSVSIKGNAGTDEYDATVATGASVTLGVNGGTANTDSYTLNTAGGTVTLDGDATALTMTINNTSKELTATLTDNQTIVGTGASSKWDITGDADVKLVVADDGSATAISDITGIALTNSGSAKVTTQIKDTAASSVVNLTKWATDTLELSETGTDTIVLDVNENSTVNFTGDSTNDDDVTLDVGNAKDGTYTGGKGTLVVNVSESLTSNALITDAGVGSLLIKATPDATTDTDADENGTAETQITINELQLNAKTTTVVVQGSEDLKITTLTNAVALGDPTALSASSMTGDLTIGTTAADLDITIVGGSGDDTIAAKGNSANNATETFIYGGDGDDTISVTVADGTATEIVKLYGDAGDDTITGSATADSIEGGTGDDTLNGAAGEDTITGGDGKDTIIMASGQDGDTIKDFVSGEDKLILTGATTAGTAKVDLSDMTVTSGAYDFDAGNGKFNVTITDSTATDVTAMVQLGKANDNGTTTNAFDLTAASGATTVKAGNFDDFIKVDAEQNITLTLGSGADTVVYAKAGTAGTATITIDDFAKGTDKVILNGTTKANTSAIDLTAVSVTSGVYDIDGEFKVTLKNGGTALTETDGTTMFQLGDATTAFTVDAGAATAVTSGIFDDYIASAGTSGKATTVNFIDNGGKDTITNFLVGTDKLSFDKITGITATSGTAVAADAAKIADASSGAVYVFADAKDGTGTEKIDTFTVDEANGITEEVILQDVADFLTAGLGVSKGETYVAIINDNKATVAGDAHAYLVNATSDTLSASDLTLIGVISEKTNTNVILAADIA